LIVKTVMAHPGNLPAARGFVRAEPANVLLSALKMASGYDSRSLVVRVYETQGRKTDAVLSFPWPFRAEETDLIERPLPEGPSLESQGEGNEVMIPVGAYEIRTFRITRTK
jgi:alpha-mannosidase